MQLALDEVHAEYTPFIVNLAAKPEWYVPKVNAAGKVRAHFISSPVTIFIRSSRFRHLHTEDRNTPRTTRRLKAQSSQNHWLSSSSWPTSSRTGTFSLRTRLNVPVYAPS